MNPSRLKIQAKIGLTEFNDFRDWFTIHTPDKQKDYRLIKLIINYKDGMQTMIATTLVKKEHVEFRVRYSIHGNIARPVQDIRIAISDKCYYIIWGAPSGMSGRMGDFHIDGSKIIELPDDIDN